MYDGGNLENAPHRWLEADHAQDCMGRREHNVGNVGWYERQRSSLGRRQSEICYTKNGVQEGHGTGWQAERRYLWGLKLNFEQKTQRTK